MGGRSIDPSISYNEAVLTNAITPTEQFTDNISRSAIADIFFSKNHPLNPLMKQTTGHKTSVSPQTQRPKTRTNKLKNTIFFINTGIFKYFATTLVEKFYENFLSSGIYSSASLCVGVTRMKVKHADVSNDERSIRVMVLNRIVGK